jgi:hypothetical protein
MNKGQERLAQFLIAGRNPTELFELIEEALHFLTSLLLLGIVADGRLAMPLRRHDRGQLSILELLAKMITVIPFIHHHILQLWHGRALVEDGIEDRRIMAGATGQPKRHTGLLIYTAGVEFGGKPTPRAAQSLCRLSAVFFRAPAAC